MKISFRLSCVSTKPMLKQYLGQIFFVVQLIHGIVFFAAVARCIVGGTWTWFLKDAKTTNFWSGMK